MSASLVLTLLTLFAIKHFICDFPLQMTPWMYRNKGIFGHPGGLAHSGIHAAGTFIVLVIGGPETLQKRDLLTLCFLDFSLHYIIDFLKVNCTMKFGLKPDNSEWYWVLLGLDQLFHALTYLAIVQYLINYFS